MPVGAMGNMKKNNREKDTNTEIQQALDIDFDIGDFDFSCDMEIGTPQQRIIRPRIDPNTIGRQMLFRNAQEFVKQLDYTPGARTFAIVDGSFIFGDVLEAMLTGDQPIVPKNIYIASLSLSQENVDSLETVIKASTCEHLYLLLSGYFYSHEKYGLVPYMLDHLDVGEKTQIAFGAYHQKIITFDTHDGHTHTLHGSANLRSSNSMEQVMYEADAFDLHKFNADVIGTLCDSYGVICHNVPRRLTRTEEREQWQAVAGIFL